MERLSLRNDRWATFRLLRSLRTDSLLLSGFHLMIITIATSLLGALYWAVAARTFSAVSVGEATTIIAAFSLATTFCMLGTQSFIITVLPARRDAHEWSRTMVAAFTTTGLASLVGGALLVAAGTAARGTLHVMGRDVELAALTIAGVVLTSWMTLLDFVAMAERATGTAVKRNVVVALLKLMLLPIAVAAGLSGPIGIVLSWLMASLAGVVVGVRLFHRYGQRLRLARRGVMREVRASLRPSFGHYLINVGNQIPFFGLPLIVAGLLGAEAAAWFYLTWRVCGMFFMISASLAVALFAEAENKPNQFATLAKRCIRWTVSLLAPTAFFFIVFGRPILRVFGPEYEQQAYGLLVVLTLSSGFDATTNIYVASLRVSRRIRAGALLTNGMAIVVLTSAIPLIRIFGVTGAGLAWTLGQATGSSWVALEILRRHRQSRLGPLLNSGVAAD